MRTMTMMVLAGLALQADAGQGIPVKPRPAPAAGSEQPVDVPIPRDLGAGKAELTVWRRSTGQWFTLAPPFTPIVWGGSGDVPL